MENYTMATDKYELTMAQIYFNEKRFDEIAYFDGYFRTNPFGGRSEEHTSELQSH